MGIDVGGCRRRVAAVSPGKFVRKPWFKACSRVERAGENIVACANATSSAVVDAPTRFARWDLIGRLGASMCHIPVGV